MSPTTDKKSQPVRQVTQAIAYIQSTFNNTIVTITDPRGNVLAWSSAGAAGFKGTKKSTPFAATQAAKQAIEKAKRFPIQEITILVAGVGSGRDAAIRAFGGSGWRALGLKDITPLPHNGPRPKKPRRV